jgi:hypothetical protein
VGLLFHYAPLLAGFVAWWRLLRHCNVTRWQHTQWAVVFVTAPDTMAVAFAGLRQVVLPDHHLGSTVL